jgi:quinol monooxygenase YgiN
MAEVAVIDWHVHPFRADRWLEAWRPAAARAMAFGASEWSLTRSVNDPLHFRQTSVWDDPEDFERYWASDEVTTVREQVLNLYNKPLAISWHDLMASESAAALPRQAS